MKNRVKILKKVEKLEAFAKAALEEATAIRLELADGGASKSSTLNREKEKQTAIVLNNRKKRIKNGAIRN